MVEDKSPFLKYIKAYPVNVLSIIRTDEEILNRIIIDYSLASAATYAFCAAYNLIEPALKAIDERFHIDTILTQVDRDILLNITNMKYDLDELERLSFKFESCCVCMWALGFIDKPIDNKKCSIKSLNEVILSASNYNDLLVKVQKRSKEELIEYSDVINKQLIELRGFKEAKNKYNEEILLMKKEAIDFITSHDLSDKEDNIKIECSKDDLNFEFIIPGYLQFDRINDKSDELIALKSDDGFTKLILQDLESSDKEEFESDCEYYINLFKDNGFEIVNTLTLDSTNLEEKIKQVVVRKGDLVLNSYFILIQEHILRLDSLIDNNINHENYNENINSKNTNIDLDLLFSIKTIN